MNARVLTEGGWLGVVRLIICCVALMEFVGCAHSESILSLEIRQGRPALKRTLPESKRVKVAVDPFEDRRVDTRLIGFQRDWLGAKTSLIVEGSDLGNSIAEVLVEEVKNRCGWEAWVAKPGVHEPEQGPDVTLHGMIEFFEISVAPGFVGTDLAAAVRIEINARYTGGRRSSHAVAESVESDWAFSFERKDLERFANSTLRKAFDRFIVQAVVGDCALQ
jgi:hypothetical protein